MSLETLLQDVTHWRDAQANDDALIATGVRNMGVITGCHETLRDCTIIDPAISLVLQGQKEAYYGDRKIAYGAGDLLIAGQAMPLLSSVITASPERPFMALGILIDMDMLRSLYSDIDASAWMGEASHGLDAGKAEPEVIDAMARLFHLGDDPVAERALAPSITREVYFRVLRSQHAGALRQLMNHDSKASRIAKAIAHIRQEYRRPIRAADLAAIAGMSASVFYEHFKEATARSPLQFQKDLRLMDAHRMLQHGDAPISSIALHVGYESPAQFSREFSRKFGAPPKSFVGARKAG
ncbi:AraC family transcriptional regulator [Cognatiyoonia sp. IB215446]|uniref:AraC family transcriptional regulator n=1 Tax=Cognatiyoonia sp. IB215446 TaxID=3097355 RepID=UPI002A184AF3|nr:AraC family transcriptional regulator [Cognatiyoonia sp. IB215446]MDX8347676.1 AraC family transcriptional regulator [Cognatiyoonia sp. IB215446]